MAGAKYEHDLHHVLTRATAFEAVMRVRATRGIRFSNFYGNYFVRGTDLLALPNCTADSSFSLDMAYDEAVLSAQAVTIQVRGSFLVSPYVHCSGRLLVTMEDAPCSTMRNACYSGYSACHANRRRCCTPPRRASAGFACTRWSSLSPRYVTSFVAHYLFRLRVLVGLRSARP